MTEGQIIKVMPKFTIWDIESVVSRQTFLKARKLFESGKVKNVKEVRDGYWATVESTKKYDVFVSSKDILQGHCNCYAGQQGNICKHALAVGLFVLDFVGGEIEKDAAPVDLVDVKILVRQGMKKIKAHSGSYKQWYSYSHGLEVGVEIIVEAVQNLPTNKTNIKYLWSLVQRLSRKLAVGGVDDSDHGAVGWCARELVQRIAGMVKEDKSLYPFAEKFSQEETGFGFEMELKDILEK